MLESILRTGLGIVVGFFIAFALIVGVELFSNIVHPLPSDFAGTHEEICRHVENYPDWILAVVVVGWGLTAAIGTWIARRVGNLTASIVLGAFLVIAVACNVWMLPYPLWFEIVILLVMPIAAVLGVRLAMPRAIEQPAL